jgi:hypothetical protein
MPARDTSAWRHAIVEKKVINLDHAGDRHVMCAWDVCEKDGYENYKFVEETGNVAAGWPSRPLTYVFCSEKHRQYWLQSYRQAKAGHSKEFMHGMLPKGYRNAI